MVLPCTDVTLPLTAEVVIGDSVQICNFCRWDKIFRHKWSNLFLHWLGWMQKPPVVTEDMLEEREQFLAALYKSPSVSFLSMILEG
jgi:hypothetical protein